MSVDANKMGRRAFTAEEDPAAMERRIYRCMCAAVAVATLGSLAAGAPWRVTAGLLLGGVLSLFNHRWLRASIVAAFSTSATDGRPRVGVARYILRYFVVGVTVAAAHMLGLVSLTATLLGLGSFAVAVLAEAFVQIYFAIVDRGEY